MAIVLASSSTIRRAMLEAAGVEFEIRPPDFDENAAKLDGEDSERLVIRLAAGKALSVPARPEDWVIGSDSTVTVDGRRFSKPRDRNEAAEHLRFFSGRILMRLSSSAVLAMGGAFRWGYAETARLDVRPLSEAFIQSYLDHEWPAVGNCVGAFRMEGRGVTLFDRVEGSHFTILGMPLVPLLKALRERGLLPT